MSADRGRNGLLKIIAAFKLVKALLLIGVGLGCFELLSPAAAAATDRWASVLSSRVGPKAADVIKTHLSSPQHSRLILVGIVAFLYAALFAVEGVGLWKARRWAEYLTIIATSSFVPFEIYELVRRLTWQRGATLGINLLVVGYLVWKVRQRPA